MDGHLILLLTMQPVVLARCGVHLLIASLSRPLSAPIYLCCLPACCPLLLTHHSYSVASAPPPHLKPPLAHLTPRSQAPAHLTKPRPHPIHLCSLSSTLTPQHSPLHTLYSSFSLTLPACLFSLSSLHYPFPSVNPLALTPQTHYLHAHSLSW